MNPLKKLFTKKPDPEIDPIREAVESWQMAEATYNECTPEWEAYCFHLMMSAQERVRALLREARHNEVR